MDANAPLTPAKPPPTTLRTARRFSITAPHIAHGSSNHLVVTLDPTGAIEIAEARHREPPVLLDLARLYVEGRLAEAKQKISRQ
jgi:hypothetical protein